MSAPQGSKTPGSARLEEPADSVAHDITDLAVATPNNKVLGKDFVTKQEIIVTERLAPFGIGAAVGGVSSALSGRGVIGGGRTTLTEDGMFVAG